MKLVNLRAAKHRFESLQKPMGRSVLFIIELIQTACFTERSRTDKSKERAAAWLLYINNENCLALAMLADAADEAILLTRILDNEDLDAAVVNAEVQSFYNKIYALFGPEQKCLEVEGYTTYMLKLLSQPLVFTVGGKTRSIGCDGGVSATIIARCVSRMNCWVVLMRATLMAEFPSFELLTSLAVFNLRGHSDHIDATVVDFSLDRVAQACHLDDATLKSQYHDVYPRACNIAAQEQLSENKDAWKVALDRINQYSVVRRSHPTDVLREALVVYFNYCSSTSGLEQNFSKGSWAINDRQKHCLPGTEEMLMKLVIDLPHNDLERVCKVARRIFAHCYGAPRQAVYASRRPRLDKGMKRPRPLTGLTEVAHLKRRRLASSAAAASSSTSDFGVPVHSATAAVMPGWTEAHSKELKFQHDKSMKRKMQAFGENMLLPSESSEALRQGQAEIDKKRVADQGARDRKQRRVMKSLTGATATDILTAIKGKPAFVAPGVSSPRLLAELARHKLQLVDCPSQADVCFAADPTDPGHRIQWASMLRGGYVLHPNVVLRDDGAGLKFDAAAKLGPRTIYVSAASLSKHNSFWKFMHKVVGGMPSAKWTWLWKDEAEYVRLKGHYKTRGRVIAVVTSEEMSRVPFANVKHVFTVKEFHEFNRRLDPCMSSSGMAHKPD